MKLKKILAFSAVAGVFTLASCGPTAATTTVAPTTTEAPTTTVAPTTTETKDEVKVLSYAEYIAAANETEVTIDAYVTDRCTWYNNASSFYLADDNGGYYVYNLACTQEEYAKLVAGAHVQITGMKSEWKGEVEINYGTVTENQGWKFVDTETKTYDAVYASDIANATLDQYKNKKVAVNNLKVTKAPYAIDKSGKEIELVPAAGQDIYFKVSDGTNELAFVVEAYLEDSQYGSDTYTKVTNLKVGDEIYLEGFVYYYDAPQMQVTKVGSTYDGFVAAAKDTEVTFTAYVQDRCTWYNNAASFYFADDNGGYYVYNLACTQEEYNTKLVPGTCVKVTGAKAEWHGEHEIAYGTVTENQGWEIVETAAKVYDAYNVADIATATLDQYKNRKVATGELTVVGDAKYGYDGSGSAKAGQDLYFTVTDGTNTLTFVVEAYLENTQFGSETYTAVEALKDGDKVTLEGFIYYYDAPQMQVTKVTKK